ncbi:uncharacterized protein BYT42DRAFT_109011 [Radiomyces spectabilis]|uniref:uncharacterized protein n=1 Tax=Radiomyces spectabilis TaxID=64574 RepID=UPI00221F300B|nr:uncharacterized protein BYT42DRAFT_109011 [Radiomyces spectabilis]KAI8369413.1 hypothetical protein BYT42DRAFT_109011 [Radiomyces spectabilis]
MLLVNMGAGKHQSNAFLRSTKSSGKKKQVDSEAKAAAKQKKTQHDDMEALQITFYEIESWIEKTTPVLARMTKELDKASHHFEKRRKEMKTQDPEDSQQHPPYQQPLLQQPYAFPSQQQQPQSSHFQSSSIPDSHSSHLPDTAMFQPLPTPRHEQQQQQQQGMSLSSSAAASAEMNDSMQWILSFQPGNSLRLETNITSIDQLVEAVHKIRLLTDPDNATVPAWLPSYSSDDILGSSSSAIDLSEPDPCTEYWHNAICRRPQSCLEKYKHGDMNFSRLTEDVSPNVLHHICQVYWDCLHPKFSADWSTFWDRSGDPKRNQVCIDSGLAIVFLHIVRHRKDACANANDISYYYYDRARDALMDFFDTPDCATLETLLNLSMFCILRKQHSQSRIYISLAYRMMLEMGMHRRARLPSSRILRKKYMKLFMVLFYNDISSSVYSGEPSQIDDEACDIDFYEIISLNTELMESGEMNYDDKTIAKETFFAHLLELAKIGKRTIRMVREYKEQHPKHHRTGELPPRWAKRVQAVEIALAQWFERLPEDYRADPQPPLTPYTPISWDKMDAQALREQSALLLMLQYQTQWILLHKSFLLPSGSSSSPFPSPMDTPSPRTPPTSSSPPPQQFADRSHAMCLDAAHRIVVMAEIITDRYGWCVCQQFISCIYQASTIYCRNALSKDDQLRQDAKCMIQRIIRVLASSRVNYNGLPDDLTDCLNEFLASHGMQAMNEDKEGFTLFDELFSTAAELPAFKGFNDTLYNSPHNHKQCLLQSSYRSSTSPTGQPPSDVVMPFSFDHAMPTKFSSAQANRRVL